MERFYQIAGIRIRAELPDDVPYSGKGSLARFGTEAGAWDQELVFRVVPELSGPEGTEVYQNPGKRIYQNGERIIRYEGAVNLSLDGAITRICRDGNRSLIEIREKSIPAGITPSVILNTMEIDHLITQAGGVILHSSYILHNGEAILFTAPSGTGKSTQASLWERYRGAEVINGDRSVIMPGEDGMMVYGLPFSGSSGICKNVSAPLKAIVCLSQAKENQLLTLKGLRAFRSIWEGCNLCRWNEQEVELASNVVMVLLDRVPVYHLACRPDAEAVDTLYQALYQEKSQ